MEIELGQYLALSAVVFGIVPGPVLDLTNHAANQLFVR